ncbi:MAG: tyrosine-type recombinase/integrase [Candidatus Binatia bacterium]
MRGVGRVFKRKQKLSDGSVVENPIWWIAFYHRGKERRKSSHSESETVARRVLKQRLKDLAKGRYIPNEERVGFEDIKTDFLNEYEVNGRRSIATAKHNVGHLEGFFGMDRAIDITPDRVLAYQNARQKEGASPATINREVAALGRMFTLAVKNGRLTYRPKFELLEGERVRQGFLEHGDFIRLLSNLPEYLQPLTEFLYLSGWRKGAARKLEWRDIDLGGRTARLRIETSKNKEPWILPLAGRLWDLIQDRLAERRLDCPYVFHVKGSPIGDFKKAWKTACKKSGLDGTLVHDLRRSAARNLSRAGVHEQVAMKITGHKTTSMYRRYRIVDENELREAQERLQRHLATQLKASVVSPMKAVG